MGCCGKILLHLFTGVLGLAKTALAITIICAVAIHLVNVTIIFQGKEFFFECLLGPWDGRNLCDFTIAMSSISLGVDLAISILLCLSCHCCGLGFIIELCFALFGSILWLATALVLTENVIEVNGEVTGDDYEQQWRNAVLGCTWGAFMCFVLLSIVFFGKLLAPICKTCHCCHHEDDDKNQDNRVHAV